MSNNQGGRYVISNGIKTQVQAPTKDRFREVYSEEEEARDNALVEQVVDALRALEKRAEELKPGVTDDKDNALPELAGRWKSVGFPKVGLAMLHHMMVEGNRDLLGAASAREVHRDAIKNARAFYPVEFPDEPLRLALREHSLAQSYGFPIATKSGKEIDTHFQMLVQKQVKSYGEKGLKQNNGQTVRNRHTKNTHAEIAEWFHKLHMSDPQQYPRSGTGYTAAAAVITDEGSKKVSKTTVETAYTNSDLYKSAITFGLFKTQKSNH